MFVTTSHFDPSLIIRSRLESTSIKFLEKLLVLITSIRLELEWLKSEKHSSLQQQKSFIFGATESRSKYDKLILKTVQVFFNLTL